MSARPGQWRPTKRQRDKLSASMKSYWKNRNDAARERLRESIAKVFREPATAKDESL